MVHMFSGDPVTKWLDSQGLPYVLTTLVGKIEEKGGLQEEGLYRIGGSTDKVKALQQAFADTHAYKTINLDEYDVPTLTSTLKNLFRNNPKLFTEDMANKLIEAAPAGAMKMKTVISTLDVQSFDALKFLFTHLHRVDANAAKNLMHASNLALLWGPTLFPDSYSATQDLAIVSKPMPPTVLMITDVATIFNRRPLPAEGRPNPVERARLQGTTPPLDTPDLGQPSVQRTTVSQDKVAMGQKFLAGLQKQK